MVYRVYIYIYISGCWWLLHLFVHIQLADYDNVDKL